MVFFFGKDKPGDFALSFVSLPERVEGLGH